MRHAFFIPFLVLLYALSAFASVQAQERSSRYYLAEALFDLAEIHYAELFTTNETTVIKEVEDAYQTVGWQWSWFYRYYPETNTYLAVNEYESSVYVYGPDFGPDIVKAGWLDEVLRRFPSGMLKPGSEECVEIGSPTPDTTAYYHHYGLGRWDQAVSWQSGTYGDVEALRHAGLFYPRQHLFTETESVTSNAGLSYLESWSKTFVRQESFSDSTWNKESLSAVYDSPGLLLAPTDRYCVGQGWFSAPMTGTSTSTYFPASNAGPMPPQSEQFETLMTASYVVSVNRPVTVEAGEFVTVEIVTNGQKRWIDVETGIPVKGYEFLNDPSLWWDWDRGPTNWFTLVALGYSGKCPARICSGN